MGSELRKIGVGDDCELAVRIDDYLLPWDTKPSVVMLHGLAESGEAFRRWVPYFATHHLVVRPDLRGYGASTPVQGDYVYRFAGLGDDIIRMLDALKLDRVFLVGGKIGGTLAMHLTAKHPDRVIAVAAVGAPASLTSFDERAPTWRKQIREQGVEAWVRETTTGRLGSSLPPGGARLVDRADVEDQGFDTGSLPADGADRRRHWGASDDQAPDAGHHHHRLGARQRRVRQGLAADDSGLEARSAARRFLSRCCHRPGCLRADDQKVLRST
ncbi:pimeloyl-ACP methyl ester carboxylesterase [Bradyrhizobium sp. GM0.4]